MCKIVGDSAKLITGSDQQKQVTTIDGSLAVQMFKDVKINPDSIMLSEKGIFTFQDLNGNSFRSELSKEQISELHSIPLLDGTVNYLKYNPITFGVGVSLFKIKKEGLRDNKSVIGNPEPQYNPTANPKAGTSESNTNLFDEARSETPLQTPDLKNDMGGMVFEVGYGRSLNLNDSKKEWKLNFNPQYISKDFNNNIHLNSSRLNVEIKEYEWNNNKNRPITYEERYNKHTGLHDLTNEDVMQNRMLLEIYHPKYIQPATEPDNNKALKFIDEPTNTFNFSNNFKKSVDPSKLKEKPDEK